MHYDLLAKIQNAERGKKNKFTTSFSKMQFAIGKVLVEAGYLDDAKKEIVGRKQYLEIKLPKKQDRAVSGFRIMSKPSRRFYVDYRGIRPVRQGYGIGVLSTPKGIMTDKEARKNKIGGEYLFEIW